MSDDWTGPQHVFVEVTGAIIRICDAPDAQAGAPFQHMIVAKIDLGVAHLSALHDDHAAVLLDRDLRRELTWRLQRIGCKSGFFLRMRDGKRHHFAIPLGKGFSG